jgi:predicted GNAT superfamily acetyltransferase
MTNQTIRLRNLEPSDYKPIIAVVNDWWGGRQMTDMLPKLFFTHFKETAFVVEKDDQIIGFLCGFLSQTFPDEAYIHFVGVHPNLRKDGIGKILYEKFFDAASSNNRSIVRCVTSTVNKTSIAFHLRMGFEATVGDAIIDGVNVHTDYDGKGESRVVFMKRL